MRQCQNSTGVVEEKPLAAAKNRAVSFQKLACLFVKGNNLFAVYLMTMKPPVQTHNTCRLCYKRCVVDKRMAVSVPSIRSPCNNRLSVLQSCNSSHFSCQTCCISFVAGVDGLYRNTLVFHEIYVHCRTPHGVAS